MPVYNYYCHHCREEFSVRHGMFFVQERCIKCHRTEGLEKKISKVLSKQDLPKETSKPGDLVKKHIEEYRDELKQMKKKAKSEEL